MSFSFEKEKDEKKTFGAKLRFAYDGDVKAPLVNTESETWFRAKVLFDSFSSKKKNE